MLRPVEKLSDSELKAIEENYRKKEAVEGGPYPLSIVLLERLRRRPCELNPRLVSEFIINQSKKELDQLITYGQIWDHFLPDQKWTGHKSLKLISDVLYKIVYLCVINNVSIITTLVVQANIRTLSDEAIQNIYHTAKELGVSVGSDPCAFVENHRRNSLVLNSEDLPF